MEPTRSSLTVQFGPAGSSGDPFCSSWTQNGQKGSPKGLSAVPTITAATTATNCFTTTLSWNLPGLAWPCSLGRLAALATLFVPPRPKTVKKDHQSFCQQYLLLPLLLLLLIALLPRFHGTDQIYGPFCFLLYHHAFMEPTRSTLTVQFGPAGSSGDPFCSSWGPKRSKRVTKGSVSSTYYYRCYKLLYELLYYRTTRLTVQFGPAGSSGDPFCSSWGPKWSKRVTKKFVSSTYYYRCYYCY